MAAACYREKPCLALPAGQKAGLSLNAVFQAAMPGLSRLGLPERSLHVRSALGLFLGIACTLRIVVALRHNPGMMPDHPPRVIRKIAENRRMALVWLIAFFTGARVCLGRCQRHRRVFVTGLASQSILQKGPVRRIAPR